MSTKDIAAYVLAEAAKSNVDKRKVGCVITNANGFIIAAGRNASFEDEEDRPDIHAEEMACEEFEDNGSGPYTAYVSQPPCPACATILLETGIANVVVVEEFIKFDGDKLRPDLVPPSATRALAEVLTFGARKYKPNNWRNCQDLSRYEAALGRHLLAYQEGEVHDKESGMPHLWHAMTNIAFLIELDKKSKYKLDQI
jgi:deoxycytidylate deaminase